MESPSTNDPHIFDFPDELVVEIFLRVVPPGRYLTKRVRRLLTISSVCRRWRNIALDTAALWTTIRSINVELVRTFVYRSRARSLLSTVILDDSPECLDLIPTVLSSLSQTRTLVISGSTLQNDGLHGMVEAWSTPAPLLVSLEAWAFRFPDNVFGGVAPALRKLYLSNCLFDLDDFPRLPELRSLYISGHDYMELGVRELVDKLRWSLYLRSLHLKCEISDAVKVSRLQVGDRLVLPVLCKLYIGCEWMEEAVLVLDCLCIPATADVVLDLDVEEEEEDYMPMLDALRRCRESRIPIRKLKLGFSSYDHTYRMEEWDDEGNGSTISLQVSGSDISIDTLHNLLRSLQLESLEEIKLDATPMWLSPIDSTFWDLLSSLPRLRVVKVHNHFARSFLFHFFDIHKTYLETIKAFAACMYMCIPAAVQSASDANPQSCQYPVLPFPALEVLQYKDLHGSLDGKIEIFIGTFGVRAFVLQRMKKVVIIGSVPLHERVRTELEKVVLWVKVKIVDADDLDAA